MNFRIILPCLLTPCLTLNAQSPYCPAPTTNGPDGGDYIARVIMGASPAIDNTTTFDAGVDYQDYTLQGTGTVTRLIPSDNYFLTIQAGTYVGDHFAAWIDFDDNTVFDPTEVVAQQQNTSNGQSMLFSFNVPVDAKEGYRRMRVRCADGMSSPDPCGTFPYGETEDYTVLVDDGDPCVPLFAYGNSEGDEVMQVSINGLDFAIPNGETGYVDARFFGNAIEIGGVNTVEVTTGIYDDDIVSVWVDWNNDGDWDDLLEDIGSANTTMPNEVVSFPLNVPNTIVLPRHVVMRVRVSYALASPCADENFGEVEDYTLAIGHPGLPCVNGISAFEEIDAFALERIEYDLFANVDASDEWPFYEYWMYSPFGSVEAGTALTHDLELTTRVIGTGVWVLLDINQDDDFDDAGEVLASVVSTVADQDHIVPLTIPASCAAGLHHFRVRSYNTANAPVNACAGNLFGGETWDTHLIVTAPGGPCIPPTLSWTVSNDAIDGVELNTLSNQNTGAPYGPYYSDYTALGTDLVMGATYTLEIDPTDANVTQFAAFIDYNDDGDLDDAGENVANVTEPAYDYYPAFTVPTGLVPGPRLLRVRAVHDMVSFPIGACEPSESGEVEDYTVNIQLNTGSEEPVASVPRLLPDASSATMVLVTGADRLGAWIEVLDASGRSILMQRVISFRTLLDLSGADGGAYTVRLRGAGEAWTGRFVHVVR